MMWRNKKIFKQLISILGLLLFCKLMAFAQIPESDNDPRGLSIPYPFVHLAHSDDSELAGTSANLRAHDPFLFYQLGRDLVQRQFRLNHGVRGKVGLLNIPLYIGTEVEGSKHGVDARFAREHTNSCGSCHSIPFREPGGGQTIASTGGNGRNTPHFYGAGLIEMIGEQIRIEILNEYDTNQNGLIDLEEIKDPSPVKIAPMRGSPLVDYGSLSPGDHGIPALNSAFRIWYLDEAGNVLKEATSLNDPGVSAFSFAFQPFGWGRGRHTLADGRKVAQGGDASTIREFFTVAADLHMGLQAYDPTQQPPERKGDEDKAGFGGLATRSLNGAQQFDFGGSVDRGTKQSATGLSLDDPDGDQVFSEFTEGDIDAVEFYLLHAPPPAVYKTPQTEQGRLLFKKIGCNKCHVENWTIKSKEENMGFPGDRRFFHLQTQTVSNAKGGFEFEGALISLYDEKESGALVPRNDSFLVKQIYSDFKHWDIGPGFHERRFDGTLQRKHKTATLWGLASTAPYGHAGNYLSIEEVILAHQNSAAQEQKAYSELSKEDKKLLLGFLESLSLYQTEEIPCDINNDGIVASHFTINDQELGYERFDTRFLFLKDPLIENIANVTDHKDRYRPLYLINNISEIYGFELPHRKDSDGDGFPDVLDPFPKQKGIIDEE